MKVLVTGATGFLGNHVVAALVKRGIPVVATGRDQDKLRNASWSGHVERVALDVARPPIHLLETLHSPSHCIHLAWSGLPNYKSELHTVDSLPQSRDFLCALLAEGLKHLLVAGTCFEYGMQEGELAESTRPEPDNPYGIAKDTLRRELENYVHGKDLCLQWARLFYMYGPGQNPNSLFPKLQAAMDNGDTMFDMSGGEQIRDYLPVADVAEAIVDIVCHPTFSGIVNVCSGRRILLKDLIQEYLNQRRASIALNLGAYPYPDWEPFRFWGNADLLARIREGQR